MTIDLKEFQQLKSDISRLRREADKAAGALSEQMKRLKEEYGCGTIKEAEALLKKLNVQADECEAKFRKLLKKFEDNWADILEQA
jgi:predicted transcriptional regulator